MQLNPPGLAVAVNERIGDPPSLPETHDTLIQPSCGLAVRSVGADGAETGFGVIEGGAVGVAVGDGGGGGGGGGGGRWGLPWGRGAGSGSGAEAVSSRCCGGSRGRRRGSRSRGPASHRR